jgi:hypothetical protein
MHRFLYLILLIQFSLSLAAQTPGDGLPRVFMIGEYEKPYEKMMTDYDKLLLNNYGDDMDKAYQAWTSVIISMEDYSKDLAFNLNGLKLWMNVFFNVDGSIQHLVYYPKPNSRNMEYAQLTQFFLDFCKSYHLKDPVQHKCSHFGSASFPTFAKRN